MPLAPPPRASATAASAKTGRAQDEATRRDPTASSSSASSSSSSPSPPSRPHAEPHHPPRSLRLHVGVFSKRKGVRYNADGRVVKCRFCEILRDRDEPFLYEDDSLVVFRPLHPIVPSHILIVPRAHIRNVNQLNVDHVGLLRRMRAVGDRVLHTHPDFQGTTAQPKKTDVPTSPANVDDCPGLTMADLDDEPFDGSDCRFAFHVPPFNSIDHVHMHAFRGETGYFGRIKYRTESWWCRSYDEVLTRLELQQQQRDHQRPEPLDHNSQLAQPTAAPVVCTR